MNKAVLKNHPLFFMVFSVLILGLVACGSLSTNEKSAPEVDKVSIERSNENVKDYLVSPYDTVLVHFSERVGDISQQQVHSDPAVELLRMDVAGWRWRVIGDSSFAKFSMFLPDTDYDIELSNITSYEGIQQKQTQQIHFKTMPILDMDFQKIGDEVQDNNQRSNADSLADSVYFFEGTKVSQGLQVAGMLTGTLEKDFDDNKDWYILFLKPSDTLEISLAGLYQKAKIQVRGPLVNDELYSKIYSSGESFSESMSFVVSADVHMGMGVSDMKAYYPYYVGILRSDEEEEGGTPYVLDVQIHKKIW